MRLSQHNCSVTLCACTSTLHTPTSTPLYEASCFANLTANVMPNLNSRSFALTLSTISPALTSESGESWHRTENKRRRGRGDKIRLALHLQSYTIHKRRSDQRNSEIGLGNR